MRMTGTPQAPPDDQDASESAEATAALSALVRALARAAAAAEFRKVEDSGRTAATEESRDAS